MWAVLVLLGALAAPGAPQRRPELLGYADKFDIRSDTIIRTQDSQALGARFMNESEVSSRDECVRICCQTPDCNVFIYEEKIPGSCYLFDCGPTDDFKCKFHTHGHYVSGVMTVNRQVAELESQIKLSKHEQELAGLRRKSTSQSKPKLTTTTTKPPTTTTTTKATPTQMITTTTGRRCSRYQFECRTSGECIAIYNACDGIPQCADGSDEGPELNCPAPPTTRPPPPPPPAPPAAPARSSGQLEGPLGQQPWAAQPPQQPQVYQPKQAVNTGQQQPSPDVPVRDTSKYYGDGDFRGQQWPPQSPQFRQPPPAQASQIQTNFHRPGPFEASEYDAAGPQSSHIFNHKTTGLMAEQEMNNAYNGRVAPNFYPNPDYHQPEVGPQWPRPQEPNMDHGPNILPAHSMEDELKMRAQQPPEGPRAPYAPQQSSDYYYEEGGQQHGVFHKHPLSPNQPTIPQQEQPIQPVVQNTVTVAPVATNQEKTTEHPMEEAHKNGHYSGSPSKKKALGHNSDAEAFQMPDGTAAKPGGAYLSLSIGLLVTAFLAALISCRLRAVRRRLRRGGKSNLAHDADFLVNGMYL